MRPLQRILRQPRLSLLLLAYVAFISLGMPDGLLGVAWPSVRAGFSIPLDALGSLLVAGTLGYMTSSFFSGRLMARWGVGSLLAASCALTGSALIGYTLVPEWWWMVLLGVFSGLGAGAIDSGLNTYMAAHYGEARMQWLHASYGVGVMLGPLIMTAALSTTDSWKPGYLTVGGIQLALAVCFVLTLPLWKRQDAPAETEAPKRLTDYQTPLAETLRLPQAWLSMLLFFLYVGAEVTLGTWTYTLLTEGRGIPTAPAGLWAGSYWATFTLGRVLAGLFSRRLGSSRLVAAGLAGALAGAALLAWHPASWTDLAAVALIGFSIAPIFPALVSGTARRVGSASAANLIGMQMTASGLGAASVPALVGLLADGISLEVIPLCIVALFAALLGLHALAQRRRRGVESRSTAG